VVVMTVVVVPWDVDKLSDWLVADDSDVDGPLDDAGVVAGIVRVKVVVTVVSPVLQVVVYVARHC